MVDYVKPETVETKPATIVEESTTVENSSTQAVWNDERTTPVMVSEMINAKKNAVSDVFISAIDRYVGILSGTIGVEQAKLYEEQLSFMRTLSNSMDLSYEDYVRVTDALVLKLRANTEVFTDDNVFRLIYLIPTSAYKRTEIDRYKQYFTALLILSRNLAQRSRIGNLIDIATLVKGYKPKVAQNITQYFQRNYS